LSKGTHDRSFIYMDNSSTTKPAPEVVESTIRVLQDEWGNPSSLHSMGSRAQDLVEKARASVASLVDAHPEEIYFTSGGTEANNWAVFGTLRAVGEGKNHIITSRLEHPSVIETCEYLRHVGYDITFVGCDRDGFIDPNAVLEAVRPNTALISIMLVQNEIGTIQPCQQIGQALSKLGPKRPRFHVDGVQGFARLQCRPKDWGADTLAMSSHKIHGPKGVGALYIRKGLSLYPLTFGGGQESGLRSGTENVPGIVGFGVACDLWKMGRKEVMDRLAHLRERLIDGILTKCPDAVLHGPREGKVAPYIVHFSFPGYRGESILHALEERGVYVSTGSACSSHKAKPSPTILALGRDETEALGSIRFSMSRYTTEDDVAHTIAALSDSLESLRAWKVSHRKR
jgi:cysteine desulfurase